MAAPGRTTCQKSAGTKLCAFNITTTLKRALNAAMYTAGHTLLYRTLKILNFFIQTWSHKRKLKQYATAGAVKCKPQKLCRKMKEYLNVDAIE